MGSNPAIPTKLLSDLAAPALMVGALSSLEMHSHSNGSLPIPEAHPRSANPLILVTNDDGVTAPGIRALAAALGSEGEVFVVAPDREVSACAQSLTLKHPLRAERLDEHTYSVDGTPADCVNLAIVKLLPRRPELVVSGINRGPEPGRGRLLLGHGRRRARGLLLRGARVRDVPDGQGRRGLRRGRVVRVPPGRDGARQGPARAHPAERERPRRGSRPARSSPSRAAASTRAPCSRASTPAAGRTTGSRRARTAG